MPVSIHLDGETSRYLSAFGIAAIVVEADRILVCHRPGDIPHTVDAIWWLRAADAERVALRARASVSNLVDAQAAVPAAARALMIGLTLHNDLLMRVKTATQRLAANVENARTTGHLQAFNTQYKARRLAASAEGKPFMSYATALKRLRGELAREAAGRSGVVTKAETADLFKAVFGESSDPPALFKAQQIFP
jgi:hypothetical protein